MFDDGKEMLFSDDLGYELSPHELTAIAECRRLYKQGLTPQLVLNSVKSRHTFTSTWQDAVRAIEAAAYIMQGQEKTKQYQEMLRCL